MHWNLCGLFVPAAAVQKQTCSIAKLGSFGCGPALAGHPFFFFFLEDAQQVEMQRRLTKGWQLALFATSFYGFFVVSWHFHPLDQGCARNSSKMVVVCMHACI